MFSASLEDIAVWQPVLQQVVFRKSMQWLQENAVTAAFRDYPLGEPGWYTNVHCYETLPETACCWENHKHTIDIQYMVSGCEGIRWTDVGQLGTPQRYLKEQDREEFDVASDNSSFVTMRSGMFVIFFPGEAHCPKIALHEPELLRKVVVKIPVSLLEAKI